MIDESLLDEDSGPEEKEENVVADMDVDSSNQVASGRSTDYESAAEDFSLRPNLLIRMIPKMYRISKSAC